VWLTSSCSCHLDAAFSTLAAAVVRVAVNAVGEDTVNGRPIWSGPKLIAVGRALVLVRAGLTTVNRCLVGIGSGLIRGRPVVFGSWLARDHQIPFPVAPPIERPERTQIEGRCTDPATPVIPHSSPTAHMSPARMPVRLEGPDRRADPQFDSTP
jgi:hypothetical protein